MLDLERPFLQYSAQKLKQYAARIEDCLSRLTPAQVWMRGGSTENSVGNLVLHVCGNVRQWIGFGVAGLEDVRERDAEFAAREGDPQVLTKRLEAIVAEAAAIVERQTAESLAQITSVQNYRLTKMEAIYHVVEHFSHHTGQIIFATKLLTGADLGYYQHLSKPASATAAMASDPTP